MINIGDVSINAVIYIPFNTYDSNNASVIITNLVAADVHIHKAGGTTQRSSAAGITVSINFDSITGNHIISIDLSDNTDAGFYSASSDYQVRLEGTTVDGQTRNFFVAMFSIENRHVASLAPGSGAISVEVSSRELTTGAETGTLSNTEQLDGVFHQIDDAAGGLDIYYEFNIGGPGVPTEVLFNGYLNSVNDSLLVRAYNWGATAWDTIDSITGQVLATVNETTFSTLSRHVGTGANSGKVRISFYSASDQGATLYIDRLWLSYFSRSVGYTNGAVWLNTVDGAAGNTPHFYGMADAPVNNVADALTISNDLALKILHFSNDSSITLAASVVEMLMTGHGWTLALGGQAITDTHIHGAQVSGICTGTGEIHFNHCTIGAVTLPPCVIHDSLFADTLTVGSAGMYSLHNNSSAVAGSGSPVYDLNKSVVSGAPVHLSIRLNSGGVTLRNVKSTDKISIEGFGQLILESSCDVGAEIVLRGNFEVTNNSDIEINQTATYRNRTFMWRDNKLEPIN